MNDKQIVDLIKIKQEELSAAIVKADSIVEDISRLVDQLAVMWGVSDNE